MAGFASTGIYGFESFAKFRRWRKGKLAQGEIVEEQDFRSALTITSIT
jgi:hypothetical protein